MYEHRILQVRARLVLIDVEDIYIYIILLFLGVILGLTSRLGDRRETRWRTREEGRLIAHTRL